MGIYYYHTHLYDARYARFFTVAMVEESPLTHFHITHKVPGLKNNEMLCHYEPNETAADYDLQHFCSATVNNFSYLYFT